MTAAKRPLAERWWSPSQTWRTDLALAETARIRRLPPHLRPHEYDRLAARLRTEGCHPITPADERTAT